MICLITTRFQRILIAIHAISIAISQFFFGLSILTFLSFWAAWRIWDPNPIAFFAASYVRLEIFSIYRRRGLPFTVIALYLSASIKPVESRRPLYNPGSLSKIPFKKGDFARKIWNRPFSMQICIHIKIQKRDAGQMAGISFLQIYDKLNKP